VETTRPGAIAFFARLPEAELEAIARVESEREIEVGGLSSQLRALPDEHDAGPAS